MTDASSSTGVVQVVTTVPDRVAAERLAVGLVQEGLVACAHVEGPLTAVYRWEGRLERADEWRVGARTSVDRADEVVRRIRDGHDHDLPEVLVLDVPGGDPDYLDWVRRSSSPGV